MAKFSSPQRQKNIQPPIQSSKNITYQVQTRTIRELYQLFRTHPQFFMESHKKIK